MKSLLLKINNTCILFALMFLSTNVFGQYNTIEFTVNGLKVLLRQTQKETLVMGMYFRGGSSNYTAANAGIESLALSGATDCGNSAFNSSDFNDQVDEYGIHLGGDVTNDYGIIKLSCISRYAEQAWKLFASAISAPSFEQQKFDLLKDQKIADLKLSFSNPDRRLAQLAKESAFSSTVYAINPAGTVESLTALNRDAVKNYYYETLLNRNRMFLVVAGNISKAALEKKILEDMAQVPARPYTEVSIKAPFIKEDSYKIESRPIATNFIAGVMNAPSFTNENYPSFRFAVIILNSVLFDVIRVNKHLAYSPGANFSEGKISYLTMYASTSQPKETVKAMYQVLSNIKSRTLSDEGIRNMKKRQILNYIKRQEVMADIVEELGEAEIMGDWKLAENYASRLQSVNGESVNYALNTYLRNIAWAYIGDAALGKETFDQ